MTFLNISLLNSLNPDFNFPFLSILDLLLFTHAAYTYPLPILPAPFGNHFNPTLLSEP